LLVFAGAEHRVSCHGCHASIEDSPGAMAISIVPVRFPVSLFVMAAVDLPDSRRRHLRKRGE
jgi:hypothetical protein